MALLDTDPPQPASGAPAPGFRSRRAYALTAYAVFFVVWWRQVGLPTDPIAAAAFLWLATIAWNSHYPVRQHLGFARDWAPIVLFLVAYDFSRGAADDLSAPHVTEMIHGDQWLFGGALPTVWLQQRFYDPHHVHWYDLAVSMIYMSHFVAAFAVAVVLWLRRRALWAAFMRRWMALITLGLVTYFLYPAAPPWWASKFGYISENVERISNRGWETIGLGLAARLLDAGQAVSNPVAAIPSLHSGFALCVVAFFFTRVRKRWIPLLAAYPLAMAVILAYAGEHYIVDALVGWVYVGAVYVGASWAERWWAARKERLVVAAAPVSPAVDVPVSRAMDAPVSPAVEVQLPVSAGERSGAQGNAGGPGLGDEQAQQR